MSHRIALPLILAGVTFSAGDAEAQVTRNCGDTDTAESRLPRILLYFTGTGAWDTLRAGKWPELPTTTPASVVTRRPDCNKIVDAVNDEIEVEYPPSSEFRDGTPLTHRIWSIGDYYVVLFRPVASVGYSPLWILDQQPIQVLWKTSG